MSTVLLDTSVFSADLRAERWPFADQYRELIDGRAIVISFITVAELRYGARRARWGAKRLAALDAHIGAVKIVWPGPGLTSEYANLRAECAEAGHGLAERAHEADRWIAATARLLDIPLVAHDAVFRGVPGLELLNAST